MSHVAGEGDEDIAFAVINNSIGSSPGSAGVAVKVGHLRESFPLFELSATTCTELAFCGTWYHVMAPRGPRVCFSSIAISPL